MALKSKLKNSLVAAAALTVVVSGVFYGSSSENLASTEQAPQALAVVETVTTKFEPRRSWNEFSGRLRAVDVAQIQPLVSGTLDQVLFEDGDWVEQGQTLFVIDTRPFEAQLQSAKANLASAESAVALARSEYERAEALFSTNAISRSIRDTRENDLRVATAAIESAEAQLELATLNLDYAHIKAPFSGRVGRAEVTAGNVLQAGPGAPVLTTLMSVDQLYAEFDVDEATYFDLVSSAQTGESLDAATSSIPVQVTLGGQVLEASLHAFDNKLDEQSGTIRARAVVDNSSRTLLPGLFANVRIGSAVETPTLLIPERAIGVSQDRRYVYVVNAEGRVEYREVSLGTAVAGSRVVLDGLSDGELVITNGLQRLMPNMEVAVAPS